WCEGGGRFRSSCRLSRSTGRGRFGRDLLSVDGVGGHHGGRRGLAQRAGGLLHGFHDVHVPRTATQVAADPLADIALGRIRVLAEQPGRLHDHPRRAEATLETVLVPERLLEWMEV